MTAEFTVRRTLGQALDSPLAWRVDLLDYHALGPSPQIALARVARFLDVEQKMRPLVYRAFLRMLEDMPAREG
jgi:hypothetical protein